MLQVAVIGASLAGLFSAAAVSRAGHQVILLERDRLDGTAETRPGVPQGAQPHIVLLRGLSAAEQLLPGLRLELQSRGAVPFDSARLAWLGEQGWLPAHASGFEIISQTRPLLEQVVLRRVLDLTGSNSGTAAGSVACTATVLRPVPGGALTPRTVIRSMPMW